MYAVIATGGKQYKVGEGDTITVMALTGRPGERVTFDRVLLLDDGREPALGMPAIESASVAGEIVAQARAPKTIAFKKRRRKNSKRKRGQRQNLTLVRITEIKASGAHG